MGDIIMEFLENVKVMFETYWPMLVAGATMIFGFIMTGLVIYNQVKPILDKIKALRQSVEDKSSEVDPLKMLQASSLATDLRAKLASPTIPDNLKLQYQSQLFELEKYLATANEVVDKGEEVTGKF